MHRTSLFPPETDSPPINPPGRTASRRRIAVEVWRLLAIVAVAGGFWLWHYEMWSWADWAVPLDYSGDAHEMLTRIKAASEGDTLPMARQVLRRLGAPWGAHWNAYPTPDKLLVIALGGLARFVGVPAAANLALLLATLSAAASFYFVARRLHAAWEWAGACAVLFAFTYSVFHRGLSHLLLVFTWTVPLGLLCCWYVARRKPLGWGSRQAWLCLLAAFSLGVSNPYNLFFWIQLLGWALIAQFVGSRRMSSLRVGVTCLAVAALAFVFVHAELWLYTQKGVMPLLVRNYGGTERYALKAVEMFVPSPMHRWDFLAFFGERYSRWSEWRGEPFHPYLGIVGMFAFVWLLFDSVWRMLKGKAPTGWGLQSGWILAYSALGGVTNLIALFFGFQIFRATNRVSIFLSCIALLFLAVRLSRLLKGRSRFVGLSLATGVMVLGVFDQIPRRDPPEKRVERSARVRSDAEFGRALEKVLPTAAMVFQLPVLGFPEVIPPHRLADYELFRPYLHTDTLKFSYGGAKFRARSRWQRDLEVLPPGELVKNLERFGFAAICIDRKGFADGAEEFLSELRALGYEKVIESPCKEQIALVLRPSPQRELPLGQTLTLGEGWYGQPVEENGRSVRWSHGPAVLTYFNPYDRPLKVRLRFRLSAASAREVALHFRGKEVAAARLSENPAEIPPITVELRPGINRFDLISPEPPVKFEGRPARLRAVGLHGVTVSAVEPPSAATPAE